MCLWGDRVRTDLEHMSDWDEGQLFRPPALSPAGHAPVGRNATALPSPLLKQSSVCVWPHVPAALDRCALEGMDVTCFPQTRWTCHTAWGSSQEGGVMYRVSRSSVGFGVLALLGKFCRVLHLHPSFSNIHWYSGISRCGFYATFEACMLWLSREVLEWIGGLLESESQSSFGNEIGSVCWLWHGCWVSLSLALADITSSSCPGRSSPFDLLAPPPPPGRTESRERQAQQRNPDSECWGDSGSGARGAWRQKQVGRDVRTRIPLKPEMASMEKPRLFMRSHSRLFSRRVASCHSLFSSDRPHAISIRVLPVFEVGWIYVDSNLIFWF